jgi:hypothetical protein
MCTAYRGEILRPRRGSVLQTTVFRYKEIGGILCTKHLRNGIVSFWRIFRQEHNFIPMFRPQYFPDFLIAEHCGLQNTSSWGSKDLASGFTHESSSPQRQSLHRLGLNPELARRWREGDCGSETSATLYAGGAVCVWHNTHVLEQNIYLWYLYDRYPWSKT